MGSTSGKDADRFKQVTGDDSTAKPGRRKGKMMVAADMEEELFIFITPPLLGRWLSK